MDNNNKMITDTPREKELETRDELFLAEVKDKRVAVLLSGGVDAMKEATEIWSNDACMGYFLRAAQIAELDQDTTRKVMGAYRAAFDEISVDEAADVYCKY